MSNARERVAWVAVVVLGLLVVAALAGVVRGGPLDPAGPPAPTSGVVQPGTPISAIPFTISQAGSYYLTRNLTMTTTGANGITINTRDVTLDLGGFTIDGGGIGHDGVIVAPGELAITIRNGTAINWTNDGFEVPVLGGVLEDIHANTNTGTGISVKGASVSRCSGEQNQQHGIDAVRSNIANCSLINNGQSGASLDSSVLENSVADANKYGVIAAAYSNVHDNTITDNNYEGIRLVGAGGSSVTDNVSDFNGQIVVAPGVYVNSNDNRIARNHVAANTQWGIYVDGSFNTIEDNNVLENKAIGINVFGAKNTVVRNSSLGNVYNNAYNNYQIAAGNNPGTYGAANTETLPWSNTQ